MVPVVSNFNPTYLQCTYVQYRSINSTNLGSYRTRCLQQVPYRTSTCSTILWKYDRLFGDKLSSDIDHRKILYSATYRTVQTVHAYLVLTNFGYRTNRCVPGTYLYVRTVIIKSQSNTCNWQQMEKYIVQLYGDCIGTPQYRTCTFVMITNSFTNNCVRYKIIIDLAIKVTIQC